MGLLDELLKAQKPKRNLMGTQMVKGPDQPYLRQDYPGLYGALGGLLGTAPDEMAGSVMDPNTAAVRQGAEYGFPVGTALGMLPAAVPAQRGAAATARFVAPKAGQLAEQYMVRTGGILPLDVYHGTPHTLPPTPRNPLGEFDASKIGTGEGAQAYGHGIYTAEAPQVAGSYKRLAAEQARMTGGMTSDTEFAYDLLSKGMDVPKVIDNFAYKYGTSMDFNNVMDAINKAQKHMNEGNLYKVDLPDKMISKMLDFDKPLSEQHPDVQKVLKDYELDYVSPSATGGRLLEEMYKAFDPATVSMHLRNAGIPGVKYLDKGSRGVGKGTRNFVTFPGEEQNLRILERNSQKAPDLLASPIDEEELRRLQSGLLYAP